MKKITVKEIIIVFILLILFMQNWLILKSSLFGYADELIAVGLLAYYLFFYKFRKGDMKLILLSVVLIVLGLSFNIIYNIQSYKIAIFEDVISMFKFLFVYLGLKAYLSNKGVRLDRIIKIIGTILRCYLLVLCLFAACNLVADIGMSPEIRYGIRSFAFIYGTPGHLINQMTYALLFLHAEREHAGKKNFIWIVCTLGLMLATLKTRAIILVAMYMSLVYFFVIRKKRKIGIEIILVLAIIAMIGASQFAYYFIENEGAPRQMFVVGAVKLVKEYFPMGTGFATYGSSAAADYYSPLYVKLGFSNRWGMTQTTQQFLNDNYLPMVFGEFGLLAGIAFLYLIYLYVKKVLKDRKNSGSIWNRMMMYFFLGDVLLSSIQSSYLAHYSVVTLSVFYFLFFYYNRRISRNDS